MPVSPAKTNEPIQMLFGGWQTYGTWAKDPCARRGSRPKWEEALLRKHEPTYCPLLSIVKEIAGVATCPLCGSRYGDCFYQIVVITDLHLQLSDNLPVLLQPVLD